MKKLKAALILIEIVILLIGLLFPLSLIAFINSVFTSKFVLPLWMNETWIIKKSDQWVESIAIRNSEI